MSGGLLIRVGIASIAAVAFSAAGEIRAPEKSPGSPPPAATQDAIAEAKKEFQGIKSVRDAALLPKGGMPRVSLPDMPSGPSPLMNAGAVPKAAPRDAKSRNWLIDAMEETQAGARDPNDPRGQKAASRDRHGKSSLRDKSNREGEQTRDSTERTQADDHGETAVVINPLTRYLGDWMTPQDYALLKPGLTESFDPKAAPRNSTVLGVPGSGNDLGGLSNLSLGSLGGPQPPGAPAAPRENPYLQSFKPDFPATPIGGVPKSISLPPIVSRAPVTIAPPPSIPPPPPTKIPEFAKPPADDKYFKQLKRF